MQWISEAVWSDRLVAYRSCTHMIIASRYRRVVDATGGVRISDSDL
jgi:hypothetical protein